jgi:O-antigen/teichoic acid export membrane protein
VLTRLRGLLRSELGQRLALATASSGLIWAVGTLATFGVGVVLARSLGPTGYGLYGTAVAVVTLFAVPAQLGLPLLATREVSAARVRGRPGEAAALGWCFTATVAALSVALAFGLWLAAGILPLAAALAPVLAVAAWLLPPLALSALAAGLLRGQERVLASQMLDVLVRPIAFAALLLLWSRPLAAPEAIAAQAVAAGAIALVGLAFFFRRLPGRFGDAPLRWRVWIGAALPMTLLELLRVVDGSYPVLVAGSLASLSDAGLLRVAMASALVVTAPISLQNIIVGPFLAGAHAAGETRRLARIIAGSTVFMTAAVATATLAIAVAGRWLLPLAFGDGFSGAYWPLLLLCLNQLLTAAFGNGAMLLAMTGQERVVVRALAISVVVAVPAALLLTPLLGILGTAASTLVATMLRGVMLNRVAVRTLGIDPSLLGAAGLLVSRSGPARSRDPAHRGE